MPAHGSCNGGDAHAHQASSGIAVDLNPRHSTNVREQWQSILRAVLKTVQWIATAVILVLFILLNRDKNGIHDQLSRTKVVKNR